MALMLSCVSLFGSSCFSPASASLDRRIPRAATTEIASPQSLCLEETKGRITKLFEKNEVCISTYDTAWVAMVPSPSSSREPCFPGSLSWLLENQCDDGSWARPHHHSLLKKDVLSSTLASILALQKWGIGEQNINRGLRFMELNSASAIDSSQITPMGFDIIFPAMIDCANNLSLNLHFDSTTINHLMNKRDLEIQRCYKSWSAETEAYLAYIGEGMGKLHKWESVISKYQRKNGSLFNSPSTTAAAFIALGNSDCLNYLNTTLKTFRSAVPAVYPLDIYSQLCLVDNLEKLGISRFFLTEIQTVLDETYRRWLDRDEEIFMDASTCAMAFRILRMNGYNVAADSFTEILQKFSCSGHIRDINTTLELYKASQVMLYPHETQLEKQNLRLRSLLQQELSRGSIQTSQLNAEVKQALEAPFYAVFSRAAMRRTVEQYNCEGIRIQKTSYCSPNFGNKDLLSLAVHDFNHCQTIHCTEFRNLYRWFVENRLDEVEYSRPIKAFLAYSYVSAAATIFAPELSDSRMSWAKNAIMVGVVDDLFDVIGSNEEKKMLIQLFELWDVDFSTKCCSHKVKVIFLTIKSLIEEVGNKASRVQGRNVKRHIISIWQDLLNSMMKEEERREEKVVPTIDEYINTAYVSFALGPVILPALYLVGPKLSEEIVNHPEYHTLYKLMSVCGRLLNDVHGYKRECKDGKHNTLSLYMMNNEGDTTKEAAISEIKSWIDVERRELLRIVLKKSVIPKSCKYFFWQMCALMHPFYNYPFDNYDDTRSFKELLTQCVSLVIDQPIILHKDL